MHSQPEVLRAITSLTEGVRSYLESHPEASESEKQVALVALRELAICTCQPEEETRRALKGIADWVVQSKNLELCKLVQNVFDQKVRVGIEALDQDIVTHIIGFLDPLSMGRSAQVCSRWHAAAHQQHLFDLTALHCPESQPLFSLFGITRPSTIRTPIEVRALYEAYAVQVYNILEGIGTSRALSKVVHDPVSLHAVLQTAYDINYPHSE